MKKVYVTPAISERSFILNDTIGKKDASFEFEGEIDVCDDNSLL